VSKEWWLDVAEVIDALRIYPRLLVTWYMGILNWAVWYQTQWYAHLVPPASRTVEVTAFYGMEMGGLFGLAAYIFKVYTDGGRDWSKRYVVSDSSTPPTHSG
jgi:hypothetical protein